MRSASIEALGKIGNPQAVDPIKLLLNDNSSNVRLIAAKTLEDKFKIKRNTFHTQSNTRKEKHLCPYCNNEIIPNTKFCAKCGKKINNNQKSESKSQNNTRKEKHLCPYCNNEIIPNTKFCAKCGKKNQ